MFSALRCTLFTYCSRQITLATGCASGWFELLGDGGDLGAHLGADVPLDEVVDLIEPHEGAERRVGEVHGRVDQELLRELDDGAVRAADVLARAPLRAQARDDLDDEVDLVREQRIEVDEGCRARAPGA